MTTNSHIAPIKRPNPLPPHHLTPAERRAELCGLLALGLVRLLQSSEVSAGIGESSLGDPAGRSGHATPTQRRQP